MRDEGLRREWAQQPRAQETDAPARLSQAVHGRARLGGEGAEHDEKDLGVIAAIGIDHRVPTAEPIGKLRGDLLVDRKPLHERKVGLVTEVGIGSAAQHGHCLALGHAGAKRDALCVEWRKKRVHLGGLG